MTDKPAKPATPAKRATAAAAPEPAKPATRAKRATAAAEPAGRPPAASAKATAAAAKQRPPRTDRRSPSYDEISQRAYFISLEEGGDDQVANWLQAERELAAA